MRALGRTGRCGPGPSGGRAPGARAAGGGHRPGLRAVRGRGHEPRRTRSSATARSRAIRRRWPGWARPWPRGSSRRAWPLAPSISRGTATPARTRTRTCRACRTGWSACAAWSSLPFAALARAGVASVMTAHVVFEAIDPDRPATLSAPVLRLLRDELGFEGCCISDDLEMKAVAEHFPLEETAPGCVLAGVDALLVCHSADRPAPRHRPRPPGGGGRPDPAGADRRGARPGPAAARVRGPAGGSAAGARAPPHPRAPGPGRSSRRRDRGPGSDRGRLTRAWARARGGTPPPPSTRARCSGPCASPARRRRDRSSPSPGSPRWP